MATLTLGLSGGGDSVNRQRVTETLSKMFVLLALRSQRCKYNTKIPFCKANSPESTSIGEALSGLRNCLNLCANDFELFQYEYCRFKRVAMRVS